MKFRSAFAVLAMTVAVTACGELPFQNKSPEAATENAHKGPPGVSPVDSPIETGTEGTLVATAESSTMNTAMFRAAGAGWTVTAANNRAVYERPGAKSTAVTVRRMTYAGGVEFIGSMNGSVFALNVQAAECKAGDASAPFTAKLRVGSQRLSGCASATDTMPKAQVTASSASPAPKKAAPKPAAAPAAKPAEAATVTPAATEAATPATATPATTTPAPASTPVTATPLAAPEAPASSAPAATSPATPAPAAPAAPAATSETPASSAPAVPAPELVLPPTPPAPAQ